MAEIILGVLCILAGLLCALATMLVLWANAMGGVTNASAVDNRPALFFLIFAVISLGGGISILVF